MKIVVQVEKKLEAEYSAFAVSVRSHLGADVSETCLSFASFVMGMRRFWKSGAQQTLGCVC